MTKHGSFYVTRYALTQGVLVLDGARCTVGNDGRILTYQRAPGAMSENFHGKEWHRTIPEAEARVAAMKLQKRKSLEEALNRLSDPIVWIQK